MQPDSGLSPARLGALIAEGYTAPRRSMALVLAMRPDERARLLMVGIGIAIGALGFALVGDRTESAEGGVILTYLVTALAGLLQYYVLAGIIGFMSKTMGGKGEREDSRTLVAWWTLVTAPLHVVMTVAFQHVTNAAIENGEAPLAVLILFGAAILSLVLLAAYIAETHRFHSTARVCGAIMMILVFFSFILTSVAGNFLPVPA